MRSFREPLQLSWIFFKYPIMEDLRSYCFRFCRVVDELDFAKCIWCLQWKLICFKIAFIYAKKTALFRYSCQRLSNGFQFVHKIWVIYYYVIFWVSILALVYGCYYTIFKNKLFRTIGFSCVHTKSFIKFWLNFFVHNRSTCDINMPMSISLFKSWLLDIL